MVTLLPNTNGMESPRESIKGTLRSLIDIQDHNSIGVCMAAAVAALQAHPGREEVLQVLQSCALESLTNTTTSELNHSRDSTKPFWHSCHKVAEAAGVPGLPQSLSNLQAFYQRTLLSITPYLQISNSILTKGETMQLLQFLCKEFWSVKVGTLLQSAGTVQDVFSHKNQQPVDERAQSVCIQNLAISHLVLSMHSSITTCLDTSSLLPGHSSQDTNTVHMAGVGISEWLCSDLLSPVLESLTHTAAVVIYHMYQLWLEDDQREMSESTTLPVDCLQRGQVLRSCSLLCDALSILANVAAISEEYALQRATAETALRLSNHYIEQLTQVAKRVPNDLPLRMWFLVLGSTLYLHSNLSSLQSILVMDTSQREYMSHLLHCIGEFCDSLREQIVSYHTQLCTENLLHDPSSHDWQSSRAFFESERCSFALQMWHYHLAGLKHDLWSIGLGEVGRKILASVLAATTAHLARRYATARPSHRRVPQFRADVLAVLVAAASFLPSISAPTCEDSTTSSEVSTIHNSCVLLLSSLALMGCSLEQLQSSLTQCQLLGQPTAVDDTTCQWSQCLDLSHFGLAPHDPRDLTRDFLVFVSLPCPRWELLLKLLTARDGALASSICKASGESMEVMFHHVASVLAHCYHQPLVLGNVFAALGNRTAVAKGVLKIESNTCLKWVSQLLKGLLQRYMLSMATIFSSKLMQAGTIHLNPDTDITELLTEIVEELENRLTLLPPALLAVLWDLSEHLAGRTTDSTSRLAKLLGVMFDSWLVFPPFVVCHLPEAVERILQAYCMVVKHMLCGIPLEESHADLDLLSLTILQAVQKQSPALQDKLRNFGSKTYLQPLQTTSASSEVTDVEHQMVAGVLATNPQAQTSLEFISKVLKTNKDPILHMLQEAATPMHLPTLTLPQTRDREESKFNPLVAVRSLGRGSFDHQWLMQPPVDWKGLLESLALRRLERDAIVKMVRNRFEFQEGAQLEGSELELVESITILLSYSDDNTV